MPEADHMTMTTSEFDTLRSDLAAFRADVEARFAGLRSDIAGLDTRMTGLRNEMDLRFVRLEAKVDEKPSVMTIYQAALTMFTGMFAVMIGTVVVLKAIGIIH